MKKNFKNIITLYLLFVVIILIFYFYSTKIVYNNLKVIDDFKSSKKSFSIKVPTKIIIKNEYLGKVTLDNNLIMSDILQYFSAITNSNSKQKNKLINDNVDTLSGTIFYSNGSTEDFTVDNSLTFENKTYTFSSYYINTLRNTLFSCFYTYPNIISIIDHNDSKIVYENSNTSHELTKSESKKLISELKKFKLMEDNKDFLNINLKESPKEVFKIFINGSNNSSANNTIYITVYSHYLVIQYLGDENGKNIYVKGDLDEKYFK